VQYNVWIPQLHVPEQLQVAVICHGKIQVI
jgi:hypothetical protein